jgi:GNAT superfamily N-acetyltransferase
MPPMREAQRDPVAESSRFSLTVLDASAVSEDVLTQLEELYVSSYYNSHMYERLLVDLNEQPEIFRLFMIRDGEAGERVVGARVIQSKPHPFVDYHGYPPIHGKRFSVAPEQRGSGLGRRIVKACNAYVFEELGESVLFGESNEIGALAMHGREGALLLADSIVRHFPRNASEDALAFFAEYVAGRPFRGLRLPVGDGVQFVYCRDEATETMFNTYGYISLPTLLERRVTAA